MNKSLTEFLYGKEFKIALDCFEGKLNKLEIKYKEFFKENNIDFKECYILSFNNRIFTYSITNEKVKHLMNTKFKEAFNDCFSSILDIK